MATRAADIASKPAWQTDPFHESATWMLIMRRHTANAGFGLAATLLLVGWLTRDLGWLTPKRGLGYALGFLSLGCMITLLMYPLRKRLRLLKFVGPLPKWFRAHMILGIAAPIAALCHAGFQLGSLNSRIALFSALAVAGSGLVGRFIYSKIHRGLYGRKATLKELLAQVKVTTPGVGKLGTLLPELQTRMTQFDRQVLVPPKNYFESLKLPFVLAVKCRLQYIRLSQFTRVSLSYKASRCDVIAAHAPRLEQAIQMHIRNHLAHVQRVASFIAYERLFSVWHKIHLPFFVLLVVSVVVHLIVVHLY
jgi:hypothetical protein